MWALSSFGSHIVYRTAHILEASENKHVASVANELDFDVWLILRRRFRIPRAYLGTLLERLLVLQRPENKIEYI